MQEYGPYLISVAKGNIFEIGVRSGMSTSSFLLGLEQRKAGHLWSLDINAGCGWFEGHPQWTYIIGDSQKPKIIRPQLPAELDVFMIDGDHSYKCVKNDLNNYHDLVKKGGLILMHDVDVTFPTTQAMIEEGWAGPGVRQAMDEFAAEHGYKSEILKGIFGLGVIYVE